MVISLLPAPALLIGSHRQWQQQCGWETRKAKSHGGWRIAAGGIHLPRNIQRLGGDNKVGVKSLLLVLGR
jgi:hypothetical protein